MCESAARPCVGQRFSATVRAMATTMWLILGTTVLAWIGAESRRSVPVPVSAGLWVGMLTVASIAWWFDRSEPWAALFTASKPAGAMLGLASALLALLIFAVDFFSNLAGANKDPERFHGRPVDTYLSSRAPITTGMYTVTFQAFTVALFALPIAQTGLTYLHGGAARLLTATWVGCFGVVSALLLLATSYALRTTLMRLRWRGNIYARILQDIKKEAKTDLRSLLLDRRTPLDAEEWVHEHLRRLDTLPSEQQDSYLKYTLGKWGLERACLAVLARATALTDSQRFRAQRTWIGQRLHGHPLAPKRADIARLHEQLGRILMSCCRALAHASDDTSLSIKVQAMCRLRLLVIGLWADRHAAAYLQDRTLASTWITPRDDILRLDIDNRSVFAWRPALLGNDDRGPELLEITYAAFTAGSRSLFPTGGPALASTKLTRDVLRSAANLSHGPTAATLTQEVTMAALRSTVGQRHADELLPLTLLRDTFVPRGPRREPPARGEGRDIAIALTRAAFTLSLDSAVMPIEQRSELLAYLDHTHVCASLLHLLQYRHRDSRATIHSDDLVPYHRRLEHLSYDADLPAARDWLMKNIRTLGSIDHFTGPEDVAWLFESLDLTDPAELVVTHLARQRENLGDHPLRTLLLWRGLVGDTWYRTGQTDVRDRLDRWQIDAVTSSVREAVDLLAPVVPQRSFELRWAFPWALNDKAEPTKPPRAPRPRRGSTERPRIPSWKAAP